MKPKLSIARIFSIVLLSLAFSSCASEMQFATSEVVPAARGYASVKKDKNHNYVIRVHIANLAEVSRLQPKKESYVIWMEANGQSVKNIGQIQSNEKLFNNTLKAKFETVSTIKPSRIFITAEDDGNIQYPGTMIILTTLNF